MTAGDDLENLSAVLGEGASKLQGSLTLVLSPQKKVEKLTLTLYSRCNPQLPQRMK